MKKLSDEKVSSIYHSVKKCHDLSNINKRYNNNNDKIILKNIILVPKYKTYINLKINTSKKIVDSCKYFLFVSYL